MSSFVLLVKLVAKLALSILTLSALGFCVAFIMEELYSRAVGERGLEPKTVAAVPSPVESADAGAPVSTASDPGGAEAEFADRVFAERSVVSDLMLEQSLAGLDLASLEERFIEMMARDLDDHRAVRFAGKTLREIASRSPEIAVATLYSLTPAERERLVPELAEGWVAADPEGAFAWIDEAWIDAEGKFIDRALQNDLYVHAIDALVSGGKDYDLAARVLEGLPDPQLRKELVQLVAQRIVRDGPESALDRIAAAGTGIFDTSVMDAIAQEWAARDSEGAMAWMLENEPDMSAAGARGITKQLVLGERDEALLAFHGGLQSREKRDSVAAEAARLQARRDPMRAVDWAKAVQGEAAKRDAVSDALYEIGYASIERSVDFIDAVYAVSDPQRDKLMYATLADWLEVDQGAVLSYLATGRARLSETSSEQLLDAIESSK